MYVRLFEEGVDTRDLMKNYLDAKDEIKKLKLELNDKTYVYEKEIAKAKQNIK